MGFINEGLTETWGEDYAPPGRIFGIQMHWILWFTVISMVFALLFRKRFGVVL